VNGGSGFGGKLLVGDGFAEAEEEILGASVAFE
jgi:hypothetical protein